MKYIDLPHGQVYTHRKICIFQYIFGVCLILFMVSACYWRGRLCFGGGRDRGFVLCISLFLRVLRWCVCVVAEPDPAPGPWDMESARRSARCGWGGLWWWLPRQSRHDSARGHGSSEAVSPEPAGDWVVQERNFGAGGPRGWAAPYSQGALESEGCAAGKGRKIHADSVGGAQAHSRAEGWAREAHTPQGRRRTSAWHGV